MNETSAKDPANRQPVSVLRRPYAPPTLTVFGQVAALTQSASNCTDDNSICQPPAINMGPTMGSDRRLKDQIVRVGTHPMGIGLYLFEYKPAYQSECGMGRQFGVMADEVLAVRPEAVSRRPDGHLQVDYGQLGIRLSH